MTKIETAKILAFIQALFPNFPRHSEKEAEFMVTAWHVVLKPFDYQTGLKAVEHYVSGKVQTYAPSASEIVELCKQIKMRGIDAALKIAHEKYQQKISLPMTGAEIEDGKNTTVVSQKGVSN